MTPTVSNHDPVHAIASASLHPRTTRNWISQFKLAQGTLIPWLASRGVSCHGAAVAEIGCAEGGVLMACVDAGASYALGTDIQGELLRTVTTKCASIAGYHVELTEHDVIYEEIPEQWHGRFDIVMLRDVIEHLDDTSIALRNIKRLLKPGGVLLVTFPPYTSPFGGHQQLLDSRMAKLPFIHMLPRSIFQRFINKTTTVNKEEVERLAVIRLSADRVRTSATAEGFEILDQRYFALRPVFRWKYGKAWIPTLEITALSGLRLVRALAMEAAFLLRVPS